MYNNSGLLAYRHSDHLGSSRFASTPSRTKYFDVAYAPFGEDYADSGTTDLSFTGQKKDTASWLYDFMFRKYNPAHGRWMSPDPAGSAVANPGFPQSWNRYAYVLGNPMSYVDELGLDCAAESIDPCGTGGWTIQKTVWGQTPDNESLLDFLATSFYGLGQLGSGDAGASGGGGGGVAGGRGRPTCGVVPLRPCTAANNSLITCNTALPSGQTVGDVVRQERAVLQNSLDAAMNAARAGSPIDPTLAIMGTLSAIARPSGPIDFKNGFRGKADSAFLGQAGNFAYYAIGFGYLPNRVLDAGAALYAVISAVRGQKPFSALTGPMFSDSSAAAVRDPALSSTGCAQ